MLYLSGCSAFLYRKFMFIHVNSYHIARHVILYFMSVSYDTLIHYVMMHSLPCIFCHFMSVYMLSFIISEQLAIYHAHGSIRDPNRPYYSDQGEVVSGPALSPSLRRRVDSEHLIAFHSPHLDSRRTFSSELSLSLSSSPLPSPQGSPLPGRRMFPESDEFRSEQSLDSFSSGRYLEPDGGRRMRQSRSRQLQP